MFGPLPLHTSPFHPRTLLQIYFPTLPPTSIPIRSLLSEIKPLDYTRLDSNNTMAHSHTTASHEYRSLWKARRTWPQKGNLGELNQAEAEKLICPLSFISSYGGHQHFDRTRRCEFGAPRSGLVTAFTDEVEDLKKPGLSSQCFAPADFRFR